MKMIYTILAMMSLSIAIDQYNQKLFVGASGWFCSCLWLIQIILRQWIKDCTREVS